MLIDWFTVVAQLINFLVLVWLLKRFLYRPVLNAMDTREKQIKERLQQAQAQQAEAQQQRELFAGKNAELERQRDSLVREATRDAQVERERLMEAARQDAAALRARQAEALQHEAQSLAQNIKERTQQEALSLTRKLLGELAGTTLEQNVVQIFIGKLQALGQNERRQLADAIASSGKVGVHTAFVLQQAERELLTRQIQTLFSTSTPVDFGTDANLVAGIALSAGGHKLEWSLQALLSEVGDSVSRPTTARQDRTS